MELKSYASAVIAVLVVVLVAWLVKVVTRKKVKKPCGRRGGLISLQTTFAFSVLFGVAIATRDPFSTLAVLTVTALLIKTKYDNKHFYQYQLIASAVLGVVVAGVAWWFAESKINPAPAYSPYDRPDMDAPRPGLDMRQEADSASASEFRIPDQHAQPVQPSNPV